MNHSSAKTGHSANVRLELSVGDQVYELAEIGPESIFLRNPVTLPPSEAEIVMHVDGRRRVWRVDLPDGTSADSQLAKTRPVSLTSLPQRAG